MLNSLMTTKYPLCCVLMELAAQMRARDLSLQLQWAPRTVNTEADALTNGVFTGFSPARRINLDPKTQAWLVLDGLMRAGKELQAEKARLKEEARRSKGSGGASAAGPGKRRRREDKLSVREPW